MFIKKRSSKISHSNYNGQKISCKMDSITSNYQTNLNDWYTSPCGEKKRCNHPHLIISVQQSGYKTLNSMKIKKKKKKTYLKQSRHILNSNHHYLEFIYLLTLFRTLQKTLYTFISRNLISTGLVASLLK